MPVSLTVNREYGGEGRGDDRPISRGEKTPTEGRDGARVACVRPLILPIVGFWGISDRGCGRNEERGRGKREERREGRNERGRGENKREEKGRPEKEEREGEEKEEKDGGKAEKGKRGEEWEITEREIT